MRLPFKVPSREKVRAWVFSKLFPQFGPDKRLVKLEDDTNTLRLLVADLAKLSGGPGWTETTSKVILDMSNQIQCLHEIVQAHHKLFEEIKRTEDMWRSGKALKKLH